VKIVVWVVVGSGSGGRRRMTAGQSQSNADPRLARGVLMVGED
jgi:hypothetical protein